MKLLHRSLSILLATLMLCCTFSTVAEVELELPEETEGIEVEIAPEDFINLTEEALELDEKLELDGLDLEDIDLVTTDSNDNQAAKTEEENAEVPVKNSASDFYIDEYGTLFKYRGNGGKVVIPNGVKTISESVFEDNESITKVTIPNSVTSIEQYAFWNCDGLTSIIIPKNVAYIDEGAFWDCDNLTKVTILSDDIDIYDAFDTTGLSFRIISGSNAIEWAEDEEYSYTVIKSLLSETSLILGPGETHKLAVYGDMTGTVTWSTSNKKVATVNNGKVTGIKNGKCTITATINDGKKLNCKVTVKDNAKLSESNTTISAADSLKVILTGGSKRKVTWSSSNKNIVKIIKGTNTYATIRGVKTGTATVTAKLAANKTLGARTLKFKVKVVPPVTFTPTDNHVKRYKNDNTFTINSSIFELNLTNNTNKTITHIDFDIIMYDSRGFTNDDFGYSWTIYFDYLYPYDTDKVKFELTGGVRRMKITNIKITFSDSTVWKQY